MGSEMCIRDSKYVVGLSSSFGKDVIPRIAAKFDSQPISDVIEVHVKID